jgi:hypothetical protein
VTEVLVIDLVANGDGVRTEFQGQLLAPSSPWPFISSARELQALGNIPGDAKIQFVRDGRCVGNYKLEGFLSLPPPKIPDHRVPERRSSQARPVSS